ncbi:nucleotidyltransferase/DNA polymerase [Mycoavidus cysteinexigens]|uniref:Nucleotidyltransferase/DNA polymerase n=1 Tax=Mycoavidus cysteinexigens TaxID=1553431 RepID=A0A2Z6EUV1_9BURK|nr:DNA polymerase Y family protein [Mycoavidus cysteinexigens]BBE09188.1 nucleotidyltransferase/DNA polymerase [Mycoavidus cysteinexigens]GLR01865.1 hypothetical protein GCM10007934_16770 [Mycoavidus cysteinexigens]
MRVWIGMHLPCLPLESFRPLWSPSDTRGWVVLEKDRVAQLDTVARALGVVPGMRRGGVLTLAPHAQIRERDPAREHTLQRSAALALLRFTPHVVLADETSVILDVYASLRLFGGIRALQRGARALIEAFGVSAHWAVAPTGQAAWLLARSGGGYALSFKTLSRVLGRQPLAILPPAQQYAEWFEGLGCRTMADLCCLPRAGLNKRCGTALLDVLDRALGTAPEAYEWLQAPPEFEARIDLPDRIEQAEAALFATRRLLLQMTGWLAAQQLAVVRFAVVLEHERGRSAIEPSIIEVALGEPMWHDAHLVRLLKERLARTELRAPVIAIRLLAKDVRTVQLHSDTLFSEPGGSATDHARLLELLVARLGRENVLQPLPLADHRPELASRWVPVDKTFISAPSSLPRPAWLLKEPIQIMLRGNRLFYGTPLRLISSAERIEAGWHDRHVVMRDYYVAQSEDHVHYWVYCERVGVNASRTPRWFLHGLFG